MDTKKHVTQDLDWRERRALDAFKEKKALCYSDLLYMMGRSTMDRLVRRGLMDTPPTRAGKYAKDFEWRLKS